jgi:general secretion pathway protein C
VGLKDPIELMNAASWLEGLPVSEKWRTLLVAQGPRAATGTLALALGVQAAMIVVTLLSGPDDSGRPAGLSLAQVPSRRNVTDVAVITNAHLFGAPPPPAAPPPQDAATAPQSTIPLVLTGVVAADDPRNGLAIIGQSTQVTRVYAVGQMVPGGAKLHSVYNDRAVISRAGHLESLALPKRDTSRLLAGPLPSTSVLPTDNALADRVRHLVTEQPGLIADIMRPQPVYQDSKLHGYRLFPGRNHQAFTRLGLHPGDLVTAVNGTPLDDPARSQDILKTLDSDPQAHVTVVRNGQPQDLVLDMAQVAQEADALDAQAAAGSAGAGAPPGVGAPPSMAPAPAGPPPNAADQGPRFMPGGVQ